MVVSHTVFAANVILKTPSTPPLRKVENGNPQNEKSMQLEAPKDGYIVKQGDTLFSIARTYGTTYPKMLEANDLQEEDIIRIGQKLIIPQTSVQALTTTNTSQQKLATNTTADTHIIRDGETLFGIARTYAISPIDLAAENNVDLSYMVKIGQKIKIPNSKPVVVAESNVPPKQTVITQERIQRNVRSKLDNRKINCELRFGWPAYSTEILHGYGETLRNGTKLDGVVIASEINKNVIASYSGEVAYIGSDIPEYGKLMIIKHKNNWMTIYGYLNGYHKKVGDQVNKGDLVATVGQTGSANGPSLYFSIRKIKAPYNPELCI